MEPNTACPPARSLGELDAIPASSEVSLNLKLSTLSPVGVAPGRGQRRGEREGRSGDRSGSLAVIPRAALPGVGPVAGRSLDLGAQSERGPQIELRESVHLERKKLHPDFH